VDHRALVDIAKDADIVVQLKCQPGDFVHPRTVLAEVFSRSICDEALLGRLSGAFALGSRRTPMQDLRFLVDELVEIAARALSPGVNDPFTARSCMDWLAAALAEAAQRPDPSVAITDCDDRMRVLCRPTSFALLVERSFGALAQYASADMIAGQHYLRSICEILLICDDPVRVSLLRARIEAFKELSDTQLSGVNARSVSDRATLILDRIGDRDALRRTRYEME
jgi:uncharacterized membrane protein